MSLTWEVRLEDQASAPAKNIANSLRMMEQRLLALRSPSTMSAISRGLDQATVAGARFEGELGKTSRVAVEVKQAVAGIGVAAQQTRIQIEGMTRAMKRPYSGMPNVFSNPWSTRGESDFDRMLRRVGPSRGVTPNYGRQFGPVFDPVRAGMGPMTGFQFGGVLKATAVRSTMEGLGALIPRYFAFYQVIQLIAASAKLAADSLETLYSKGIEQSNKRAALERTFEILAPGRGHQQYRQSVAISDVSGRSRQEVATAIQRFTALGRNTATSASLALALADLTAANPDRGAYHRASDALSRILAGGTVTGGVGGLGKATLGQMDMPALLSAVERRFGVGRQGAIGMLMGPRRAYAVQEALIYRAKQLSGGTLGGMAQQYGSRDLAGGIQTLDNRLNGLFDSINREPLSRFVANLNTALGETSPLTERIRTTFDATFNGIIGPWIRDYDGKEGLGRLNKDLGLLAGVLDRISGALRLVSLETHAIVAPIRNLMESIPGAGAIRGLGLPNPLQGLGPIPTEGMAAYLKLMQVSEQMRTEAMQKNDTFLRGGQQGPVPFPNLMPGVVRGASAPPATPRVPGGTAAPHGANGSPTSGSVQVNLGGVNVKVDGHGDGDELGMQIGRRTARELQSPLEQIALYLTGRVA